MTILKMRPIIFSGENIRAILDGRKTQTRRVVKFPEGAYIPDTSWIASVNLDGLGNWIAWGPHPVSNKDSISAYPRGGGFPCPYGKPHDGLWVRETFVIGHVDELPDDDRPYQTMTEEEINWSPWDALYRVPFYRATEPEPHIVPYDLEDGLDDRTRWSPSIFMPRWASRITLQILNVRVERLQDISDDDALAEGVHNEMDIAWQHKDDTPIGFFGELWDSINAKRGYGWETNPWVWVIEFKRVV
jgi:hypothetical protein